MKQRIYIDTSVISALHDTRTPERRELTTIFWDRLPEFESSTSEITLREIGKTPDPQRRELMESTIAGLTIFTLTDEMLALAAKYVDAGIFDRTQQADAIHVAAAVASRHDVLISWNFKHLVNRRRRGLVNAMNVQLGLSAVDIISPPEV